MFNDHDYTVTYFKPNISSRCCAFERRYRAAFSLIDAQTQDQLHRMLDSLIRWTTDAKKKRAAINTRLWISEIRTSALRSDRNQRIELIKLDQTTKHFYLRHYQWLIFSKVAIMILHHRSHDPNDLDFQDCDLKKALDISVINYLHERSSKRYQIKQLICHDLKW